MRSFTEPPGFRYSSLASSSPGHVAAEPLEPHDRRMPDELEHGGKLAARHCGGTLLFPAQIGIHECEFRSRRSLKASASRPQSPLRLKRPELTSRFYESAQNSPVRPTASRSACDCSIVLGRQPGSSRDHHQARASSFICGAGTVAPGSQPLAASQRSRCSSDRRKTIVLQVNADVVPPPARGNEHMAEEVCARDQLAFADDELEAVATARALGFDVPVGVERPGDPERVPAARSGPGATAGAHSMRSRCEAERVRHPDVSGAGEEHERVGIVQPPIGVRDLVVEASNAAAASAVLGGRPFATTDRYTCRRTSRSRRPSVPEVAPVR